MEGRCGEGGGYTSGGNHVVFGTVIIAHDVAMLRAAVIILLVLDDRC
jgi:hypothetical protein